MNLIVRSMKNKHLVSDVLQSPTVHRSWISHDFIRLMLIFGGPGANFDEFWCLGDGLEIQ